MALVESRYDAATGIGRLTLDQPEVLNAIDVPMARAFLAATRTLTAEPGLRVILIEGSGRAFCAGGNVAGFLEEGIDRAGAVIDALLDALNPAILALRQSPAPVVTAVRGVAAGAGLSLALSGDVVVAAEGAKFVVAYDRIGAPPDCGLSWFLPRRVGRGRAFQMMLRPTDVPADRALAWGLVDEILPEAEFAAGVDRLLERIASGPTGAYGRYKALIDGGLGLGDHLEAERRSFVAATRSADFAEGVAAFRERRKTAFAGR